MSMTSTPATNSHSPFPTWSPEVSFPLHRADFSVPRRARAHSMATQSFKNLSLTPRLQTSFTPTPIILDPGTWAHGEQKGYQDFDFSGLDSDATEGSQSAMASDEDAPIIHIRQTGNLNAHNASNTLFGPLDSRRPSEMSDSTYSLASSGRITEDMSLTSDGDWTSQQLTSQSRSFSPIQSPRQSHELIRTGSRSRASPMTHNNNRTSPYNIESRQKRWSTGTFASPTPPPRPSHVRNSSYFGRSPLNPHHGLSSVSNDQGITTFAAPGQPLAYSQRSGPHAYHAGMFNTNGMFGEAPKPLPSQTLFSMLPSHGDRMHGFGRQLTEVSEPPNLWASLEDAPSDPPEEDMNPSDPDMKPQQQEPRFPGDLYTPRWVRGHGNKREGYCGYCKPGRWLVLKNSGYWYDRLFTHGVCNDTGAPFQAPLESRPTDGNADGWEGLCGGCNDWVNLVSNKKKATSWFRHAKNCHTHTKVKDASKRRRNTYAGIRRPTISEDSDLSMTNDSGVKDEESKTSVSTSTTLLETSFQEPARNLEEKGTSDISAAVSPRTTVDDTHVPHLVTPMVLDHEEKEPLTATRTTLDLEKHLGPHVEAQDQPQMQDLTEVNGQSSAYGHESQDHTTHVDSHGTAPDLMSNRYFQLDSENTHYSSSHYMGDGYVNTHDNKPHHELNNDIQMMNMYSFSNLRTPLQTPQLTDTPMSTPQINTPEQHVHPTYGLGVHIPLPSMGIPMVHNMLDQEGFNNFSASTPAQSSPKSHPSHAMDHDNQTPMTATVTQGLQISADLHSLTSTFSNGTNTSSHQYPPCDAPTAHSLTSMSDEMLANMDMNMAFHMDMDGNHNNTNNAMALHPFTWA